MDNADASPDHQETQAPVQLPRVTIKFCTQCRWMLRAAYFAQELLSTFSLSLGEVALIPTTGGVFTIDLIHSLRPSDSKGIASSASLDKSPVTVRLWDRKAEGGFPEVKHLKQLLRNHIDPTRDLGHSDTPAKSLPPTTTLGPPVSTPSPFANITHSPMTTHLPDDPSTALAHPRTPTNEPSTAPSAAMPTSALGPQ